MNALRRCRNNIEADNIVLIDVDTYRFNNVIVIDAPDSHTKKQGGSDVRSRPSAPYIYIDDDESPSNHHARSSVDVERTFNNGASSSRRYDSDMPFAQENISPVKISKGKRTYSGRGSNIRNGLNIQSDSDSSESESPDCEFMDDTSGNIREQWERASLKRKAYAHNAHEKKGKSAVQSENQPVYTQVNQFEDSLADSGASARDDVDVVCGKSDLPVDCSQLSPVNRDEKYEQMPSISSQEEDGKSDLVNVPTIDAAPAENSIIDQREKLKETDEYKRALEQELSARQIALKIQAEEAQQLRRLQKRKKAETLRLLDMERRQKQRVEEIRETQKKDVENMNLKEQYRMVVRQELKKLEITCLDMASLLRGLGIQVGDSSIPASNQVRAAYKRALLSFHPDRASGSDMRQQVEAEEKFKLISRMKEKFPL